MRRKYETIGYHGNNSKKKQYYQLFCFNKQYYAKHCSHINPLQYDTESERDREKE